MKKNRGSTIGFGVFFGFVAYAITVFFVSPKIALSFGVLTASVYILVLSLIMDRTAQKYENVDDFITSDILLKRYRELLFRQNDFAWHSVSDY